MRQSQLFIPTVRETPADAVSKSHKMMLKAGMIKQLASGLYTYLPIARLVLLNIENIVRKEMNAIGSAEVMMPILHPKDLWVESGRWQEYGDELMRMSDRHDNDFCLGPTHEEVVVDLVRDELKSYKKLPLTLYQIQTKFRDERRPRYGLLRGREFIMKDAYSFHLDDESLDDVYKKMSKAYHSILTQLELDFRPVIADSGAIGGKDTEEFMALSEIGEDIVVYTDTSDYAANIEKAGCKRGEKASGEMLPKEKIATPNVSSCESLAKLLEVDLAKTTKTMIVRVDDEVKMILVRGDHELNDIKVKSYFNATEVTIVDKNEVESIIGATPGSLGPVGVDIEVYIDYKVEEMLNYPVGANEDGYHFVNVNHGRDYEAAGVDDFRFITEGEIVEDGSGTAKFMKGIEVGQVFKLGTRYSEAMNLTVLDENGRSQFVKMGCYGFGVSRSLSAVVEKHHDETGIIWPKSITPFDVHIITTNIKDEEAVAKAEALYSELEKDYKVLYDDRNERAGVKFNDSDLIGVPVRIVFGRGVKDGLVEVKFRNNDDKVEIKIEDCIEYLNEQY